MKKTLAILVGLGVLVAAADDSYLYWMVGSAADSLTYTEARVAYYTDSSDTRTGYLSLYAPDLETESGTAVSYANLLTADSTSPNTVGLYAQLMSDTSYNSFAIELWNDSTFVGWSGKYTYSEALAGMNILTPGSITAGLTTAWAGSSYSVPEPNSGLLMLLGMAALGLNRRRLRKAA